MTVDEARKLLKVPLVFGNPTQIAARDLLREVDDCKEALLDCEYDHFAEEVRGKKWRRAVRLCECVMKWAPESEEERGGDWSIIDAAIAEALKCETSTS